MTLPLQFEISSSSKLDLPLPPDLLRRFVALQYRGTWSIAGVAFDVETNREVLLQSFPLQPGAAGTSSVRLRVVVDPDLEPANDSAPLIIHSPQLCWAHIYGLLFVFDRASGEAFIFVPEAQVQAFRPTFEELLRRAEPILADDATGPALNRSGACRRSPAKK